MAIIEINSNQISFDANSFLNLKSVIPKLQKNFPFSDFLLSNLSINGEKVDINDSSVCMTRQLLNSDIIRINIEGKKIIQYDMIEELSSFISIINAKIDTCTIELNSETNTSHLLQKIIEAIDLFVQTSSELVSNIITEADERNSLPVKSLQIHLLSVIKAISSAQKSNDIIILTDLLEYELKDNLTQWKILILPTLKKQALITI